MSSIRPIAICVFRHANEILVARGFDDIKQEHFFRPLGGAIEFGETAAEALRREIREELGAEIEELKRLGILENRFTYRGLPGHEIVFVFDAAFEDSRLYAQSELPIREDVWDGPARWLSLENPLPGALYPDGLMELLRLSRSPRAEDAPRRTLP